MCTKHATRAAPYQCSGHRAANSPDAGLLVPTPNKGDEITAAAVDNLRAQIRAEVNRWNDHSWYSSVNDNGVKPNAADRIRQGDNMEATQYNKLDDKVHELYSKSASANLAPNFTHGTPYNLVPSPVRDIETALIDINKLKSNEITRDDYASLVDQYNQMRMDCICNSDCSCNNVCNCHSDCGCNYSDARLKTEITYC